MNGGGPSRSHENASDIDRGVGRRSPRCVPIRSRQPVPEHGEQTVGRETASADTPSGRRDAAFDCLPGRRHERNSKESKDDNTSTTKSINSSSTTTNNKSNNNIDNGRIVVGVSSKRAQAAVKVQRAFRGHRGRDRAAGEGRKLARKLAVEREHWAEKARQANRHFGRLPRPTLPGIYGF